ncbi:hypothetical protein [Streptomyces flavofungini]|uniref:hypothetical protein n=1 Tax=Streptomyces flavofungini TaxID=68200 RepID=UPI0034DE7E5C
MKRALVAVSLAAAPMAVAAPALATEANPPLGSTVGQGIDQSNHILVGKENGVAQQLANSAVEVVRSALN